MKGIVFTEFIEMVEQQFGLSVVDEMLQHADSKTNGSYTAVGTYPHSELANMIVYLHHQTKISVSDLMRTYGRYLFGQLAKNYPALLADVTSAFDLIENLETIIHVEVKKLYPDSNPPLFVTESRTDNQLIVTYHSSRSMSDVAEGLINGCGDYYNESYVIQQEALNEAKSIVRFIINKI
jgi:hypothetical protein